MYVLRFKPVGVVDTSASPVRSAMSWEPAIPRVSVPVNPPNPFTTTSYVDAFTWVTALTDPALTAKSAVETFCTGTSNA